MSVAAGALAQTNSLPPIPPPLTASPTIAPPPAEITNAPAKKSAPAKHKKKVAAKKAAAPKKVAFVEPAVTLVPGPAEVAVDNLNVRGQAGLKGEFITHISKGSTVNVLSQINLDKPKAGEPAAWAKISLPTNAFVWVRSSFIDSTNKTVLPKKLNLRAGPGENYSVLGVIERGAAVSEVITKGEWTQIEPPASTYAFVAAIYLKQEASGTMVPTNIPASAETAVTPIAAIPEPPATTNTVAEAPAIVSQPPPTVPPTDTNSAMAVPPPTTPAPVSTPAVPDTTTTEVDTNPPPPRIVTHEGSVRSSVSMVAPTYFELYDPANNKAINYLFSPTTNLNLARYDGYKIIVTGEEGLDSRWKDTPVLTVQRIYVVSTNSPGSRISTPRGSNAH
jgi:uncharacterized protein YgiM (DUF1202 family)